MPTDLLLFFGGLLLGLLVAGFSGFLYVDHLLNRIERLETTRDTYIDMYGDRSAAILKIWEIVKKEMQ